MDEKKQVRRADSLARAVVIPIDMEVPVHILKARNKGVTILKGNTISKM